MEVSYEINNVWVLTQSFLRKIDEFWVLNKMDEFPRGCLIRIYRENVLEYDKRPDIVDKISEEIGQKDWDYILVDWDW